MTDETIERTEIISQLIQLNKNVEKQENLLIAVVLQNIELNKLMKKLNYISGTDSGVTKEEVEEEIEFLKEHIDCFSDEAKEVVKRLSLPLKKEVGK